MVWDDHLAARRFFSWVHRPVSGPGPLPGPVLRMGTSGSRVRGYAPLLGEHNRLVMEQVVGLDPREFDRLNADGVFR
jgi:crotonobetainyl-CoA:carnitine CoA-transferase CaiB-like acyl-CoA transferase